MHRARIHITRSIAHLAGVLTTRQRRDNGASLVEYALLVALIAIVCIAAVAYFGGETSDTFSRVANSVTTT